MQVEMSDGKGIQPASMMHELLWIKVRTPAEALRHREKVVPLLTIAIANFISLDVLVSPFGREGGGDKQHKQVCDRTI